MEALLTYDSSTLCCDVFWLHLDNEDKMFRPDNEDAKFVYKLKFDPTVAQKYEWDSAVFKAGPFVDPELKTYERLADLKGQLISRLYGEASLQIRDKTLPGILIEFVEGQQLYDYSSETGFLTEESQSKIRKQIDQFTQALNQSGVQHGDPNASNMLIHRPNESSMSITFIDFDSSIIDNSKAKISDGNKNDMIEWLF